MVYSEQPKALVGSYIYHMVVTINICVSKVARWPEYAVEGSVIGRGRCRGP